MGRPELRFAWIEDQNARNIAFQKKMKEWMKMVEDLTILCDTSACLTFLNRDDGKMVAWPSLEEAKSLIDRFNALPETKRDENAYDQESYIETNIKMIEMRVEHSRKVVEELEMDHLMLQIQNGRMLADLSQPEIEKLMPYASKKIRCFERDLGMRHDPDASVDEPFPGAEIPKAKEVAPEGGLCFRPMGRGSVYLMDKWFFIDPEVEKHGDGTHMASRINLNMVPSDDNHDDLETNEGESSKSGGADDG